MAFDRPLEADQVDDLNLFSMLLRAPILGTLIWILGGDASRKEEEEARRRPDIQSFSECKTHSSDASLTPSLRSSQSRPRKSALKKKSSSKVGSDLSNLCDHDGNANDCALQYEDLQITRSSSSSTSCSAKDSLQKVRKKELSWSDESGHELAKYDNEVTLRDRHNPVSASEGSSSQDELAATPRTYSVPYSVTANSMGIESKEGETTSRYLPKMTNRSKNDVIAPSRPSTASGIESPQWGWYINTTPPTPDMYHCSRSSLHKKQDSSANASQASGGTAASDSSTATSPTSQPNRIFQDMQDKRQGASMGWASVPL